MTSWVPQNMPWASLTMVQYVCTFSCHPAFHSPSSETCDNPEIRSIHIKWYVTVVLWYILLQYISDVVKQIMDAHKIDLVILPSQSQNHGSSQRHWRHAPCWTNDPLAPFSGQESPFCTMPPPGLSASRNLTQKDFVVHFCVFGWFWVKNDHITKKLKQITTTLQYLTSQLDPIGIWWTSRS